MELKKRHKIEEAFHDAWAKVIDLGEIDPRRSFEAVTSAENRQIMQWMGAIRGKRILDLGCGLGDAAVYFAMQGAKVTAVDISPGMVSVVKRLAKREKVSGRVKAMRAVGEKLPFKDASFDFVYGNGVLHHLDTEVSGPEIARVLKKGGRGIFIEPLAYNPVINVYRALASGVRTEAEAPMTYAKFRRLGSYFKSYRLEELQFLTLGILLWFFFIEFQNPSKVRYWKKIVNEDAKYGPAFKVLRAIEKGLLAVLPFLKPLCWNVVVEYQK